MTMAGNGWVTEGWIGVVEGWVGLFEGWVTVTGVAESERVVSVF